MNKYLKMTDWNEILEKRDAGKCFHKNTDGVAYLSTDTTFWSAIEYYKLNPNFDTWVELDIKRWEEWGCQCGGKECEMRNDERDPWFPCILAGIDTTYSNPFFYAGHNYKHCRVKKSLLEG